MLLPIKSHMASSSAAKMMTNPINKRLGQRLFTFLMVFLPGAGQNIWQTPPCALYTPAPGFLSRDHAKEEGIM
jgi:hypothetical protein